MKYNKRPLAFKVSAVIWRSREEAGDAFDIEKVNLAELGLKLPRQGQECPSHQD